MRFVNRRTFVPLVVVTVQISWATSAASQIPQKFENLQFFPRDTPRDSLLQVMRGFSFALGVRCQHCHTGGDGVSFEGVNFASDDKAAKRNARFMLRMVDSLNTTVLAALPERTKPPVVVECATCHRGLSKPTTLARTLAQTITEQGVDSAVARYRMVLEKQPNNQAARRRVEEMTKQ